MTPATGNWAHMPRNRAARVFEQERNHLQVLVPVTGGLLHGGVLLWPNLCWLEIQVKAPLNRVNRASCKRTRFYRAVSRTPISYTLWSLRSFGMTSLLEPGTRNERERDCRTGYISVFSRSRWILECLKIMPDRCLRIRELCGKAPSEALITHSARLSGNCERPFTSTTCGSDFVAASTRPS